MGSILSFVGLSFTLVGAALLFFYGLPVKRIGHVTIFGLTALEVAGDVESKLAPEEWQRQANAFLARAKVLNRAGFGLVAIGTLLQMIGILA